MILYLPFYLYSRDRKKKKFVQPGSDEPKLKKIKTESGNWINASYKSGLYEKWKQKSKIEHQTNDGDGEDSDGGGGDGEAVAKLQQTRNRNIENASRRQAKTKLKRAPKRELKTKEEIFKVRNKLEKQQGYQKWKTAERQKTSKGKKGNNNNNNQRKKSKPRR